MMASSKHDMGKLAFDKLVSFLKSIHHQYDQVALSGMKRINAANDVATRSTIVQQLVESSKQFVRDFNSIVPVFRSDRRALKFRLTNLSNQTDIRTIIQIIKESHGTWTELFGEINEALGEDKNTDANLIESVVRAQHRVERDASQYVEVFASMNFTALTMPFGLSNSPNMSDVVLPAVYVIKIVKGALTYVALRMCVESFKNQVAIGKTKPDFWWIVVRFMGLMLMLDLLLFVVSAATEEAAGLDMSLGVAEWLSVDFVISDVVMLFIAAGTLMTLQRRTFFQTKDPDAVLNTFVSITTYVIIANSFIPYFLIY